MSNLSEYVKKDYKKLIDDILYFSSSEIKNDVYKIFNLAIDDAYSQGKKDANKSDDILKLLKYLCKDLTPYTESTEEYYEENKKYFLDWKNYKLNKFIRLFGCEHGLYIRAEQYGGRYDHVPHEYIVEYSHIRLVLFLEWINNGNESLTNFRKDNEFSASFWAYEDGESLVEKSIRNDGLQSERFWKIFNKQTENVISECNCDSNGDSSKCQKIWYCCDCKKKMMHSTGDLFARCECCWQNLEAKI